MSIYVIAAVDKHMDAESLRAYESYVTGAGPAIEKYQVGVLASDENPQVIEGSCPAGKVVILKFRDKAHVDEWYNSPEYQSVLPLRLANGDTRFVITVEGIE